MEQLESRWLLNGWHAAIGDFVWEDLNANGVQDQGEPGIPGVTVNIFPCDGATPPVDNTTTTDSNGLYHFVDLVPGDFQVQFILPDGYVFTKQDAAAATDATDSDADPTTGMTICTTLATSEFDFTWDAGMVRSEPNIQIIKLTNGTDNDDPTGPIVTVGDQITWTYQVTNPGTVPLYDVAVTDDNGTPGDTSDDFIPTYTGGDTNGDGALDIGEEWIYTATGVAQEGQYENMASVSGHDSLGQQVGADNPDHYFGEVPVKPQIDIVKMADKSVVCALGKVTYTYDVSNPGTIPLSDVKVVDDNGTPQNTADDFTPTFVGGDTNNDGLLDTTEVWHYTACVIPKVTSDACSSVSSCFTCTPIKAGKTIWFNSVVDMDCVPAGSTLAIQDSTIQFTSGTTKYTVNVPDSFIIFSETAKTATTVYDATQKAWITTVPKSYGGDVFLTGVPFVVPCDLKGGIQNVTWNIKAQANQSGLTGKWKWAAAVYSGFSGDLNALGVKPVDGKAANPYLNCDEAGTPESFKKCVISGAKGAGGTNYTGCYSNWGCLKFSIPNKTCITNTAVVTGIGAGITVSDFDTATVCVVPRKCCSSIAGSVFIDKNNNGKKDCGEFGVPCVKITLTGTTIFGENVTLTTTTNLCGDFAFKNLCEGTYKIVETQPCLLRDGLDHVGTAGGVLGNDIIDQIKLGDSQIATGYLFGELPLKLC